MKRASGVLLAVSSLPSPYGIGGFGKAAREWIDFLERAGQRYWQILPMGPTGYGDSPYQSFSAFAGNPYFIDLEQRIDEGLLSVSECARACGDGESELVDYGMLARNRLELLRTAFFRARGDSELEKSVRQFEEEQAAWLDGHATFLAIKRAMGGKALLHWDEALRTREERRLSHLCEELAEEIKFRKYLEYWFFRDWQALRRYAHKKEVRILGDLPIYVSADSADVWLNPHLFELDEKGNPLAVAGCPPDAFSPTGQLWGNPLYQWKRHEKEGYAWWILRMKHAFSLYDAVRIDHFRGFDAYYSIPFGAKDATVGQWERGPGKALFDALEGALGRREIIAEDLGFVTDSVRELVRECGFSGMKILQFGFTDGPDSQNEYRPYAYPEQSVAYTGTHDNPTLLSWLRGLSQKEERSLREYLGDFERPKEELRLSVLRLAMSSPSRLCVIPMQDLLGLDDRCGRMNRPATAEGNWRWRMRKDALSASLETELRELTETYGRL